ncbi:hypothetical protein FRC08_016188 [Ceratobasidium sp. 394]|nr:hypothetical protein FRC08_016188 [Ceratobasidium sp. 394]
MAALVRNRTPRQAAHISPAQSHHPPLHTPAAPAPAASALASPPTVSPPLPTRLGSPHTLPATSSTAVKRRAASPAPRPSPKRSRSQEEADDSFLALLLPPDMSRFSLPSQPVDAWAPPHRDDDRVTLPPIAEDRRASLPVASSSGYVFTNTFESPRPGTAASSPGQPLVNRRPQMHNRTFSSPVLPAHTMQVRGNAIGLQDDPLAFSPHGIPPGAIDWLGPNMQSRPVSRDDGSMSEFDPTFGLDSGANSPAFAFGPGPSPFSGFSPQFHPRSQQPLNIAQALASSAGPSPMNSPAPGMPIDPALGSMPTPSRDQLEGELSAVRAKIRELEFLNDLLQLRVVELESDKNKAPDAAKKPTSPEFEASWEARTEARIKRFCSLNRAGNALCAWHDSRRERRSYPPRMAPPGYLNCGCTFEEALFEESLARHAVGSYHPGESVRMDPALRNPLLKLLQWRFGYKDGDFERDPASGEWVDGEGEQAWEPTRTAGSSSSRRHRSND